MKKKIWLGLAGVFAMVLAASPAFFFGGWMPASVPDEPAPPETSIVAHWRADHVGFADPAYLEVTVIANSDSVVADTLIISSPMRTGNFIVEAEEQRVSRSGKQMLATRTFLFRCMTFLPLQEGYGLSPGIVTFLAPGKKLATTAWYNPPKLFIASRLLLQDFLEPSFKPDRLESPAFTQPFWFAILLRVAPWMLAFATVGVVAWTLVSLWRSTPVQTDQNITLRLCRSKLKKAAKAAHNASSYEDLQCLCDTAWYWFMEALRLSPSSNDRQAVLKLLDALAFGYPVRLSLEEFRAVSRQTIEQALFSIRVSPCERIRQWIRR